MATSKDYIEFVLEQVKDFGDVTARKMFGEYMVYANEKPVLLVCDNSVFVKICRNRAFSGTALSRKTDNFNSVQG